jgi:lysine 2,3-aminomutase
MAGIDKNGHFPEKISPFLSQKMEGIAEQFGKESEQYLALARQYMRSPLEEAAGFHEDNDRHWHATLQVAPEASQLNGLERLYKKSVVVEPTMICAAHCRYCLRGRYDSFTLNESELNQIAKYCGAPSVADELEEILITGGDPFLVPDKLAFFVSKLREYAPNIKIVRIGTRLISQNPDRISNKIYDMFKYTEGIRFEVATQINHACEIFEESEAVIARLRSLGVTIYSQNIVLKGINDNVQSLAQLYLKMRVLGIEPHYLFHCVPMKGMHHFRTSVAKGLELIRGLTNSGIISGRIKPMYAAMTDIGKITLYEGVIKEKRADGYILLQSNYSVDDRLRWNPHWQMPATASVGENGMLQVAYLDGED